MSTCPQTGFTLKHEIFILDAHLKEILDPNQKISLATDLVGDLLAKLKMFPLGDLQIFDATDLRAPGWSFLQGITTSHVSGHYFDKPGKHPHIRLDTYSCCTVDWQEIVNIVDKHLNLADWSATFIDRQIDQPRAYLEVKGFGRNILSQTTDIMKSTAKTPVLA